MALLEAKKLGITFGGLRAVDDFNLTINEGELVGLIGPNGAGKTTIFNMLTGVYLPTDGSICIDGVSIIGNKPYEVVDKGAARTFQNIRLFSNLSVLDNVKIAFQKEMSYNTISGIFRLASYRKEEAVADKKCRELLTLFSMEHLADVTAKNLPYGQQRKLEIARALATNPRILMLDEPAAGMNPQETIELMETIHFIRDKFQIAILLIEHDMHLVMNICERLVVINYGKVIAKGTPDEIKTNPEVISAYLGQ